MKIQTLLKFYVLFIVLFDILCTPDFTVNFYLPTLIHFLSWISSPWAHFGNSSP